MMRLAVHPNMQTPPMVIPITLLVDKNLDGFSGSVSLLYDNQSYDLRFSYADLTSPNPRFTVTNDRGHLLLTPDDLTADHLNQNQQLLADLMARIVPMRALALEFKRSPEFISGGEREPFTVGHIERRTILSQLDLVVARGNESKVQEFFTWLQAQKVE